MKDREFQFACALLDDHQSLIAADKTQRWGIVKWVVTLNVALAAVSVAVATVAAALLFLYLSIAMAIAAALLVAYYNNRMTKVRRDAFITQQYLAAQEIDFAKITGKPLKRPGWFYDWDELAVLAAMLFLSIFPAGFVWGILAGSSE